MKLSRFGPIGLSAVLLACGGSSKPPPGGDAGPPAVLTITWPVSGSKVVLDADVDKSLPVSFTVQNLAVAPQGQCNGTATCAHVEVFVDGDGCSAGGRDNAEGGSSPVKAKLAKCSPPTGLHTVRLELHYDDYTPVLDALSHPVGAEVTVTALMPSVSITSPTPGSMVTLASDSTLQVAFTLQDFILMAPGSCSAGSQGTCGSVFLLIDGTACNNMTGGVDQGFNNLLVVSPGAAKFIWCHPPLSGSHTVILELHNDDKTPLKNASGATLAASVSVTVP
jgi:hypothetical protein